MIALKKYNPSTCLKLYLFIVLTFVTTLTFAQNKNLDLSAEELQWIKDNPVLKVSALRDYPPSDFITEGNKPNGISIDLIRLYLSKLGIKPDFQTQYSWSELLQLAYANEIPFRLISGML